MGNSGKHVFVLGAGASYESANTPLARDLVWNYHHDCADLLRSDNNGKPDHSEEDINYSNFRKFFQLVAPIYPDLTCLPKEWENRGWKVFYLHEELLKKHPLDVILGRLQEGGDKEGVELVKQLIFEHIVQASLDCSNILYKRFVNEILKNKASQTTSVISLNFDCMLVDREFDNEVYFDYLIDFDWIDPNRGFYKCSNPIPLIKLHGSLDWGICKNCGWLHLYYPFMHRTSYEGKACDNQHCGGIVAPVIAIPPYEEYEKKMNSLWNVARDHLKEADKVTVIGYSFPKYDEYVIKLFQDSLDTNVHIEVVDKCLAGQKKEQTECFKNRYKKLFKRSIEVTLDGFCGYLDSQGKPC